MIQVISDFDLMMRGLKYVFRRVICWTDGRYSYDRFDINEIVDGGQHIRRNKNWRTKTFEVSCKHIATYSGNEEQFKNEVEINTWTRNSIVINFVVERSR